MISVRRVVSDYLSSNMYILEEGQHSLMIDPCDSVPEELNKTVIDGIFITHEHYDHISGVNIYAEKYNAPVYAGEVCSQRIVDPVLNASRHFNAFAFLRKQPCEKTVSDYSCSADRIVSDGESILWQEYSIVNIYTPGHTDSSYSFLIDGMLFTGDAIMFDEHGNPAAPDRHFVDEYYHITLPVLRTLSEDTIVYPGHGDRFFLKDYLLRCEKNSP